MIDVNTDFRSGASSRCARLLARGTEGTSQQTACVMCCLKWPGLNKPTLSHIRGHPGVLIIQQRGAPATRARWSCNQAARRFISVAARLGTTA
ncbi:hypothetical protein E2C01_014272 [Portunus trituberculatus]|uniref:Uncharacterized protein n=1 Tax=Portunus trituberculatus TaxID=210409 RepID=A0A5B7DIQ9_PORTR|nr:hypothetical protein [Portunus trituberculatus]